MALPNFFRADEWVKTTTGQAVSGAHVYWLNQPTTSVPASENLIPAPQATIYADPAGANPLAQPVVTDGFGHADAYMGAGLYTIAIYVNGSLFASFPDQNVAASPLAAAVSSLNGLTGTLTLAAGANITFGTVGNTITINGPATGVTSLNALTGALSITAGTGITVTPSGSNVQVALSGGGLPASPLLGDIARFNVNGDGLWDAVPFPQKFAMGVQTSATGTVSQFGYIEGSSFISGVTNAQVAPTATQTWGVKTSFASNASTNMGLAPFGWSATQMLYNIMNWQRITFTMAALLPTSIRHWWGIFVNGTGTGTGNNTGNTNQVLITNGSTVVFTDTPNKTFIAFRYSSTTDTHWQAICSVAGASSPSQTIVDTGITPDTNTHVFDIVQNFAQTAITFYIDGSLVATITTNIPNGNSANAGDNTAGICFSCDNKNVSGTMGFTFFNAKMTLRN